MRERVDRFQRRTGAWVAAFLALAIVAACTSESPRESARVDPVAAEPIGAGPTAVPRSTFLWHATMESAPGELWLLGSVHVRSREDTSLDRAVTDALAASDRAVFEANFEDPGANEAAQFTVEHGLLPAGERLADQLPPELYASWADTVTRAGLATTVYDRMRPWLAAYSVQIAHLDKTGYAWDAGVDHVVFALAKREPSRPREILGLETALEQLEMLRQSSPEVQEAMIRDSIRAIETNESETLLALYVDGDERGLAELIAAARAENPTLEPFWEDLLDRRNERMVERLLPRFDQAGSTFVTVGAAHLYGDEGLLGLLEAAGARVRAVPPRGPAPEDLLALAREEARPTSERFASEEDGFSVVMGATPVVQTLETAPGTRVNSYTVGVGLRSALIVTVAHLPHDPAPTDTRSLGAFASSVLEVAGIAPGSPEPADLAGEPAVRVAGSTTEAAGEATAARRGDRVYVVSGLATSSDEADRTELSARYGAMRKSFRWEP